MVEVDFVTVVIPITVAVAVSLFLGFIKKVGKTSEGTLSGTIKLEHVSSELGELEKRLEKNFDKMELLIITKDKEQRDSLVKIWDRLEKLTRDHDMNTYRIGELERRKSPV